MYPPTTSKQRIFLYIYVIYYNESKINLRLHLAIYYNEVNSDKEIDFTYKASKFPDLDPLGYEIRSTLEQKIVLNTLCR